MTWPEVSSQTHYVVFYTRLERKRQSLVKRMQQWGRGECLEASRLQVIYKTRHLYYAIRLQHHHDVHCQVARVDDISGDWAILDNRALMTLWLAHQGDPNGYFTEDDPYACT